MPVQQRSGPAPIPYIFISYARENAAIAERIIADLAAAGISCWLDKLEIKVGSPNWQNAVRAAIRDAVAFVLIATPESRQSEPVHLEVSLAWGDGKDIYPLWAGGEDYRRECIWEIFENIQAADIRGDAYDTGVNELIEMIGRNTGVSGERKHTSSETPRNPYKGLRPFRRDDIADYFGREGFIADLVDTVRKRQDNGRFIAIVGASGSGKSSAVMAGLLPRLQAGAIPASGKQVGSERWRYLEPFTPGVNPIENLAARLGNALPNKSTAPILDDLRHPSCRGLHRLAAQMAGQVERVVVVVDQFEEVFTQSTDADEREQFINLLTTAASEPGGAAQIVITLRGDFYDRALAHTDLNRLLQSGIVNVPQLSVADLVEVVKLPAERAGLRFDDGLVNDIVFDVRDRSDAQNRGAALPLLQFTLDKLFRESQKDGDSWQLTRAAYERIGKVQGALAQHADETLREVTAGLPERERLVRVLFSKLVSPGEDEQDVVRRRATVSDLTLADVAQTALLREMAEAFVQARLLMVGRQANSDVTFEVSHETLLREWPWLSEWIQQNREEIRFLRVLHEDAEAWDAHARDASYHYTGTRLISMYEDFRNLHLEPGKLEAEFMRACTWDHNNLNSARRYSTRSRISSLTSLIILVWTCSMLMTSLRLCVASNGIQMPPTDWFELVYGIFRESPFMIISILGFVVMIWLLYRKLKEMQSIRRLARL